MNITSIGKRKEPTFQDLIMQYYKNKKVIEMKKVSKIPTTLEIE